MKRLYFLFCMIQCMHAREYLYPVATIDRNSQDYVYLIHQISLKQLQLLELHVASSVITQIVPLAVTPAGFKLLPDQSGYSFIDQGQLYVKLFAKKSPQKIDLTEPLYHVEIVEWTDALNCYFSAKRHGRYAIYDFNRSTGSLKIIAQQAHADCLYPQKMSDVLFYIERSYGKKKYRIQCINYSSSSTILDAQSQTIFDAGDQPIAFLYMKNIQEGYYVSYPASISSSIDGMSTCVEMAYYRLYYDHSQDEWKNQLLFNFSVPLDMVLPDSKERLYESLLPLLPRHTDSGIFYCSCGQSKDLDKTVPVHRNHQGTWYDPQSIAMYYYDSVTFNSTLIVRRNNEDIVSPVPLNNSLLYGTSIAGKTKNRILLPGMWRNEYGQICYTVPSISLPVAQKVSEILRL